MLGWTGSYSGLVLGTDGNFYGTTKYGGACNAGTIYRITPAGALTTLNSFGGDAGCHGGAYPLSALMEASDGNFYGTTYGGGPSYGYGTVYKMTPDGTVTVTPRILSHLTRMRGRGKPGRGTR